MPEIEVRPPSSIAELISRLGEPKDLAEETGRPAGTIASWKHRNMLPIDAWPEFIALSTRKGVPGVSAELLLELNLADPMAPVSEIAGGSVS